MSLIERYSDKIKGIISCHDRVVIQGILPGFCFAEGMTSYLYAHKLRIFDYPHFAEPMRDAIRNNAEALAIKNGLEIEFIRKSHIRKEDIISKILERRGTHPGLVHILSAMEACQSYKPWHNKTTGKTLLKPDTGKCLHYYFYFIDRNWGFVMSVFPLGVLSVFSFISMVIRGLLTSLHRTTFPAIFLITPSRTLMILKKPKRYPTNWMPLCFTVALMNMQRSTAQ
jgi:hypothetical protein